MRCFGVELHGLKRLDDIQWGEKIGHSWSSIVHVYKNYTPVAFIPLI